MPGAVYEKGYDMKKGRTRSVLTGLFAGITGNPYVYFVHSYYLTADDPAIVSSRTSYGVSIDASVQKGNIFATQFHPEKSGSAGLDMLRNFAAITRGEER